MPINLKKSSLKYKDHEGNMQDLGLPVGGIITDITLTKLGVSADAKATGEKISHLEATVNDLKNQGSGQPTTVTLASEMTDTTKTYLYMGSEEGYEKGYTYYYDSSTNAWTKGVLYGGEASGLTSTASTLLISILRKCVTNGNISNLITQLETELNSTGGSGDSGGDGGEDTPTITDDITVSDGVMTILSVGSDISVSDGVMTIS